MYHHDDADGLAAALLESEQFFSELSFTNGSRFAFDHSFFFFGRERAEGKARFPAWVLLRDLLLTVAGGEPLRAGRHQKIASYGKIGPNAGVQLFCLRKDRDFNCRQAGASFK